MTVLLRKRNLSTKQFSIKALDIQTETARLAHKESVVPKSYRFTFGVPMCETARSMVANIERADASYPNTSWGVIERKKSLAMAIADANTLYDLIACLIEVRKGPRKERPDAGEENPEKRDARRGGGIDLKELGAHFIDRQGEVGLGLGDEPNQVHAVAYLSPIDHFVTECCDVEAYGRYMDDLYAIHTDKEHLKMVAACIESLCLARGMRLNPRKTRIVKLSRGFTFLKKRFSYTETGKVLVRPCRTTITKQRRKLKAMAKLVAEGKMTREQAIQAYQSWRGGLLHLDAQKTVESMDALFRELFDPVNTCRGGVSLK